MSESTAPRHDEPEGTAATDPAIEPDAQSAEPKPTTTQEDLLARTKASQIWIGLIVFAVVLILLLIFVLQNTRRVRITYFTADFTMPLAVAMLLSAVAGILLAAIAGTLRIIQLRRRVKNASSQ